MATVGCSGCWRRCAPSPPVWPQQNGPPQGITPRPGHSCLCVGPRPRVRPLLEDERHQHVDAVGNNLSVLHVHRLLLDPGRLDPSTRRSGRKWPRSYGRWPKRSPRCPTVRQPHMCSAYSPTCSTGPEVRVVCSGNGRRGLTWHVVGVRRSRSRSCQVPGNFPVAAGGYGAQSMVADSCLE